MNVDLFFLKKIADKLLLLFPEGGLIVRIMTSHIKVTGKDDLITIIKKTNQLTKFEKGFLLYDPSDVTELHDSDILELLP